MPKKKRKKYKTGIYHSNKGGICKYRSGWELAYMQHLDNNDSVCSFRYEPFKISYVSNTKTKKMRLYNPDFLVTYVDGTEHLVEIKPKRKLASRNVIKKINAAYEWCAQNKMSFTVLTEDDLRKLNLL